MARRWIDIIHRMVVQVVRRLSPIGARTAVRIIMPSALTTDRIFSGMNEPNPPGTGSTPSAARQSHAPIRIGKGNEP
jgi:hypothetical protein